jgi:hypothetical protein
MIASGRCHGPGCRETAVVEYWCSERCQLNWDRQAAGLAPVTPWPLPGYVSPVTRAGGFLTPAAARSLTAIQRDLETRFAEALAVDHVQTPPTVPATVAVDGEVTRDTDPTFPSDLAANPHVAPDPTRGWLSKLIDRWTRRTT